MASVYVLSDSLDSVFRDATRVVREILGGSDIGGFKLRVEAMGRTLTGEGEVRIVYTVAGQYGEESVSGKSLSLVLAEFARRQGWDKANAPLCLAAPVVEIVEE